MSTMGFLLLRHGLWRNADALEDLRRGFPVSLGERSEFIGRVGLRDECGIFVESLHLRRVYCPRELRVKPLHDRLRRPARSPHAEIALKARVAARFPQRRHYGHV